ncbi:TonB-dependent receptor domain-containing protein [Aminobacter aganoensis]|uniref:Hemoglobin/transferrin/lactoferrin receptor protein n=1 Tax=Aminobacter aganoensis TaxID=83264 RepID=A0A7X0F431_9HYPH|nr:MULTISPECIES: TonB-dependent receptor [Aminobacter]MBB6352713.1 hemoglobin/transferrin/lactoferrin receptor protein [Aminobacter aganoensis]
MGLVARNKAALLGGAAMALLVGMHAANAQEAQTNEQDKKGRVTILQRLIFGAGAEKVAIDTPQSVSVIDQDDIDQKQAETIGELVKTIPGVNVSGSDRTLGQTFNIRGIGGPESGGEEGRIIVNVDGATKFYEQYRMGGLFTDTELYKRVEVLRGPASSTLYGSGALGGVINFTTKDASDFLADGQKGALRLKTAFDSNSEGALGSAILATRLNDNFEVLAAGNYRYANSYTSGDGTEVPGSEIGAPSGLLKGTYRFGDNNEQALRASYMHWQTDENDQYYNQTGIDVPPGFGTVDRKVTDKTAIISYENPASDNPWLDLKVQASFSDTVNDQSDATLASLNRTFGYKTYQFNIQNTFDYEGANFVNHLTVGSQSNYQERTTLKSLSGTHPQGERTATGAFVQNEFIWDERLTLIAGARLDWQRLEPTDIAAAASKDHTAFSPKIAAHYKLNDTFAVFGSIAHTERVPTIDEVFDSAQIGRPDLKKELSNNYEAGVAVSLYDLAQQGDSLQLKTTGFYNDITDLITDNGRLANPRFTNIGQARIYGAEVELGYDSDYVFGNAAYSYVIGEDLLNDTALNTVAPHEFAFTVGGRMPDRDLSFGWTSRFVAGQDRVSDLPNMRLPVPSFSTHDVFLTWKPQDGVLKGFETNFRVDNIFNEQYREFLSGTAGKGRTFKLTLAKQLDW